MDAERKFIGHWCWLLPLTYLAHIAEEYWGGFPAWMSALSGAELSPQRFLALNALAWAVMAAVVALAVGTRYLRWLVIALCATVCVNGAAHLLASLATRGYSPGLLTGITFWLPLGMCGLRRAWGRVERRVWLGGVAAGLLLHGAATFLAIGSRLLP
jgi:hypothetical protein